MQCSLNTIWALTFKFSFHAGSPTFQKIHSINFVSASVALGLGGQSVMRGYLVYKDIWDAAEGEALRHVPESRMQFFSQLLLPPS